MKLRTHLLWVICSPGAQRLASHREKLARDASQVGAQRVDTLFSVIYIPIFIHMYRGHIGSRAQGLELQRDYMGIM